MGWTPAKPARVFRAAVGAIVLLAPLHAARAQDSEYLTIKAGSETIREIAKQYLGDPDLWTEIMRASGLRSITELRPGVELKVPATAI
jgi:nucleoid-associated protein YgaU